MSAIIQPQNKQNQRQKIPMENAEVIFYPQFFKPEETPKLFSELQTQINWKQEAIKIFGKQHLQPRLTAYYGDKPYPYSGIVMESQPWIPVLLNIKSPIETQLNTQFNAVLLNQYRDGKDGMGWHSDDERELASNSVIASISFGETRRFLFRRKDNHKQKMELSLADGDLLIMAGETQTFWQHQIPKTCRLISSRINLTFRSIK